MGCVPSRHHRIAPDGEAQRPPIPPPPVAPKRISAPLSSGRMPQSLDRTSLYSSSQVSAPSPTVRRLVVDVGSGAVKAGVAGAEAPSCVFPHIIGEVKYLDALRTPDRESKTFIGAEAERKRGLLALRYPMADGHIQDWETMERVWRYTFEETNVDPSETAMLFTETPQTTRSEREKTAQIMFETFSVPALYVQNQAVLALHASGLSNGVVVDLGDGVSFITPVLCGSALPHAARRLGASGRDVTQMLARLLQEEGVQPMNSSAEMEIIRNVKEMLACVHDVAPDKSVSTNRPATAEIYTMPDGQAIRVGEARFQCGEVLFTPSVAGLTGEGVVDGLFAALADDSVKPWRRELSSNVVLCGSTSLMPGLHPRIVKSVLAQCPPQLPVRVNAPLDRHLSVWKGGSMIASSSAFSEMWVSAADYSESGPRILSWKCYWCVVASVNAPVIAFMRGSTSLAVFAAVAYRLSRVHSDISLNTLSTFKRQLFLPSSGDRSVF